MGDHIHIWQLIPKFDVTIATAVDWEGMRTVMLKQVVLAFFFFLTHWPELSHGINISCIPLYVKCNLHSHMLKAMFDLKLVAFLGVFWRRQASHMCLAFEPIVVACVYCVIHFKRFVCLKL